MRVDPVTAWAAIQVLAEGCRDDSAQKSKPLHLLVRQFGDLPRDRQAEICRDIKTLMDCLPSLSSALETKLGDSG